MSERERGRPARGLAEGGGDATLPADATVAIPGGSGNVPRPDTLLSQLRQTDSGATFELPALPADAYEIGPEVARGGMGRVVRAIDHRLGRVVALKLLLGQGPDLRARFAREAQITAGLQHPSIVPIYEAGTWSDGNLAYAMKLVSGESLEAAITACTSLEERMALLPRFIDVVDAVAYAHSERVVHRDIKPSNIILGEFGETILIDWGVAKSLDVEEEAAALEALLPVDSDASRLTALGAVVGTPVYMPPEQAAGDTIDDRADVYSLGAVLYQLLTGLLPYTGANPLDVLRKVALKPPAPLESIDPHIPPELAAVVARAMARERGDRYSAVELAAELRRYTTGKLVAAYHYSARERFVRWVRRHRAPVVVAAAALAVVVVVATLSAVRIIRERDRAQTSDRRRRALVADQYAEQGRILLLGGDRLRAIAYFLAAGEEGARGAALDYLLARAATSLAQKRHQLIGHRGPVPFITFDPTGARVFTVSDDGTARVWDPATGKQLHMVSGRPLEVLGGELAPGGEEILTFSKNGTAQVWSFAPGDREPIVLGERVTCARYSGDGKRVVTGGPDGRVRVFDRASRRTLADFTAHKGLVLDVWLDASGAHLWSAGEDGVVAVSTPQGGALRRWKLERGAVLGITASPDGGRIATILRDGAVAVWSGGFESPPDILELGEPVSSGVRWSPSRLVPVFIARGTRLAVPVNRSVQIIDLVARRRLHSLTGHQGEVTWVTTSPDDTLIATASSDGGVRLWDPVDGRLESILPTVDHVQMVAFAPRGQLVATASYSGAAVWLPAPDPPIRRLIGHATSIYSVRFRPDGKRLVTASGDKTVRIWDVASGRELARLAIGAPVTGAVYDPAGRRLVVTDDSGVATVWDADANLKLTTLERRKQGLMAAEFSPDGRLIAVAGDDGEVRLWDATSFGKVATLSHPAAVNALAFDKTGVRIVTVTQDGGARIWDARTGQVLVTIPLDGPGLAAAFSPDGTRVIVSARQTARIHDATSGRLRASLDAHQREVGAVRLTADGLAVTGGYDQSTKIWDAETGRVLASHEGHGQWIMGVDLDPSGRLAATCDLDGVVILWQLPRETRSPAQVVKDLGSRLEFSVRDGLLVSRSKH